jgi:hypothetical protein
MLQIYVCQRRQRRVLDRAVTETAGEMPKEAGYDQPCMPKEFRGRPPRGY